MLSPLAKPFSLFYEIFHFLPYSTILFALLLLVICATIYEDSLITKGINHNDDDDDDEAEGRRTKAVGRHSENNNNNDDKYEMNHINNNNNNSNHESECEMSKVHEESDLHKPGESCRRQSKVQNKNMCRQR